MLDLKYQYGRLSYRRKSTGIEYGREDWSLTRNRDSTVTMRCLAMTDDSKLVRDVIYTRSRDGHPIDAFIRLQAADRLTGAGYFRVHAGRMDVITDGAASGHSVQTISVPTDFFSIMTRALMLDAWIYFNYDRAKGGEQLRTFYKTSDGAEGPLGRMETCRVKLIGEEEVGVPAGNFKAAHFQVTTDTPKSSVADIWVAGEDRILLRFDSGEFDLECALASWKVEQSRREQV
ncbi:MAG: hypothetical protein AB7U82_24190 [Blastocatellales bacterium]